MNNILIKNLSVSVAWANIHSWDSGATLPQQGVSGYALWLGLSNTVEIVTSEKNLSLRPGIAMLIPPNLKRTISTPDGASWLSIGINARVFREINPLESLELPVIWEPPRQERRTMDGWMRQIVREWWKDAPSKKISLPSKGHTRYLPSNPLTILASDGLAQALFSLCWRYIADPTQHPEPHRSASPSWLPGLLEQVAQSPFVTVNELSDASGLSPAQFRRLFHQSVGISPMAFLTERRLETACNLLATTELTINEIASQVGISSVSYFTRLFTRTFGTSPGQYRQQIRQPGL